MRAARGRPTGAGSALPTPPCSTWSGH